jgi:hypothetical protein
MRNVEVLDAGAGDVEGLLIGVAMSTKTSDVACFGVSSSGVLELELGGGV